MKHFITNKKVRTLFILAFWLIVWQIAAMIIDQPLYLPSVFNTIKTLVKLITKADFWKNVSATFIRVLGGLGLSFVLGVLLATIASKSKFIALLLSPFLSTVKAIPTMSIIILALVWINTNLVPVFVCFLLCFPIIYTNTLNGIKNIDIKLLEVCIIYHIRFKKRFFELIIPSIKPYILSALMICIGFSWKSVIAAEVLCAPKLSMGYKLYTTKMYLDIPELFAYTTAVVIFSILIEKGLKSIFVKKGEPIEH